MLATELLNELTPLFTGLHKRLEEVEKRTDPLIGEDGKPIDLTPKATLKVTWAVLLAIFVAGGAWTGGTISTRESIKREVLAETDRKLQQYPTWLQIRDVLDTRLDRMRDDILKRIDERLRR